MKITNRRHTAARWAAAALVATTLAAACGGDDDGGDADEPTTTTVAETTTTALDEAAATADINETLVAFFAALSEGDLDGATAMLQNGEEYREEMVHCADLTAGVSVEPKTVEFTDDVTATTTFDILIGGAVVLEGAGGGAANVDGVWLVSENTFLSLYDAAKDGCTGPPPVE